MGILRRQASRDERLQILKGLKYPTQKNAEDYHALLNSVDANLLLRHAARIIISRKSYQPSPNPYLDMENVESISLRMEVSPNQALDELEKLKNFEINARKKRPSNKKAIVSKKDYQDLKSYLKHCIDLNGKLTMPKRRKRFGIKLHSAFRLILTAYEISDDSESIKIKSKFEKNAFQTAGLQFRVLTTNAQT